MHADEYVGLDDDMPDDYNDWLSELSSDDFIRYADAYAEIKCKESK